MCTYVCNVHMYVILEKLHGNLRQLSNQQDIHQLEKTAKPEWAWPKIVWRLKNLHVKSQLSNFISS